MSKLDLDFLKTGPASPWLRWLLLALALGFVTDLGVSYHTMRNRMAQNEAGLAELKRNAHGSANAALALHAPTPEEIRVARDTVQRLAMPWYSLFRALESATSDKIALLAIAPEAKSGTVLISGEATDFRAALDYVSELGRTGALDRPHLVRHEIGPADAGSPVRFSISANWSNAE